MKGFPRVWILVVAVAAFVLVGCAPKVDWASRLGRYTYDDAVREMGPPDRSAVISDGSTVADWVDGPVYSTPPPPGAWGWRSRVWPGPMNLGPGQVQILRLTFGADKKLSLWRRLVR